MTWDEIAAIAQVIAAVGVVASLAYLAAQIRRGTAQAKSDAFIKMNEGAIDLTVRLASDLPLSRTLFAAGKDWHAVSPQQQYQAHMINLAEMQLYESWHHMMCLGQIDAATWASREDHVVRRISSPGVRYWWDHHSYNLDPRFIARINARLDQPNRLPAFGAEAMFDPDRWEGRE